MVSLSMQLMFKPLFVTPRQTFLAWSLHHQRIPHHLITTSTCAAINREIAISPQACSFVRSVYWSVDIV